MFRPLCLSVFLTVSPLAATAQSVQEQIIAQLTEQGFGEFEIRRTLLGRVRIVTTSDTLQREMVFNPNTGEILRDYWEPLPGRAASPQIQIADPSASDSDSAAPATRPPRPPRPPRPARPLRPAPSPPDN